MSTKVDVVRRAEELLDGPVRHLGYELVACEFRTIGGRPTLQVFVDREGGVGIADCVAVNRGIGDLLEVEELLEGTFNLEVSSPGLDRPLRKEADFLRFVGREVRIRTFEPIDGRRNYRGFIRGAEDGMVTVEVDTRPHEVPVAAMERANLIYDDRHVRGSDGPKGKGKSKGKSKGKGRRPGAGR